MKYENLLTNRNRFIKEITIIIFISILLGIIYNTFSEHGLPLLYKPLDIKTGSLLSFEEVQSVYKQKDALFIDAREKSEFEEGHIPDALNIPAGMGRSKKMALLNQIPKNLRIIIYCSNPDCHQAHRLAKEMQYLDFTSVSVFEGGWEAWLEEHGPVSGGSYDK